MAPETSIYPLYNTTFTLHRVSPFYTGTSNLTNSTLSTHARHLHDILRGESLRGVRVGLGSNSEDNLARVGALQRVQWRTLATESGFNPEETFGDDDTSVEIAEQAGNVLDIIYEKAEYRAILLNSGKEKGDGVDEGFTKLPCLLTRMPGSLRETVLDFLTTTFDVRISTLKLSSGFMSENLEKYLADLLQPTDSDETITSTTANKFLRQTIKDLLITVAFTDGVALKNMDILISKDDIYRMIMRGNKLQQTHQGQEQGNAILAALKHYIQGNMALDIGHENVKVSRIASAAFVLGSEGKMKLFPPQLTSTETLEDGIRVQATNALVKRLVAAASLKEVVSAG